MGLQPAVQPRHRAASLPGSWGSPLTLQFDVLSINVGGIVKIEFWADEARTIQLGVATWDPVDLSALGHFSFSAPMPAGTNYVTPVIGVTGAGGVGVFDNIRLDFVSGPVSGGYVYTDNGDGTCTITDYVGPGGDLIIPDTLVGLTVVAIGNSAFSYFDEGNIITSITIPDSVTSIGSYAFENCWDLVDAAIGSGVTSIGDWVFDGCSSLTAITVDANNNFYSSIDGVLPYRLIPLSQGVQVQRFNVLLFGVVIHWCPLLNGVCRPS